MLPATGSTMTAAIVRVLGERAARPRRGRCTGATSVSATAPGVHAGRVGQAERRDARAGLHEQEVGVAVVAAGELDDLRAAGERARDAAARSSSPRCPS